MRNVVVFLIVLGVATGQNLVKMPPTPEVMISDLYPGLKLECYLNSTDPVVRAEEIVWMMSGDETGKEVQIDQQFVKVDEDGHSILRSVFISRLI